MAPGDPHAPRSAGKRVAIMQPYFFPYIGYYQLIASVDEFVIYDNIKYTKKGWINRNRIFLNGAPATFSIALQHAPDSAMIVERVISSEYDRSRLLRSFASAYRRAPFFAETFPVIESIAVNAKNNLFHYLADSIRQLCAHLGIDTRILASSSVPADHSLKSQDRVIAMCQALDAEIYINPIGGTQLYSKDAFAREGGLDLFFLRSRQISYDQFGHVRIPSLSIIDVLMFNGSAVVRDWIQREYDLI